MPGAPQNFVVKDLENRTQRIDTAYFNPSYRLTMKKLSQVSRAKGMEVHDLDFYLNKASPSHLTGGATPKGALYVHEGIRFLRVQNVRENELALAKCVRIVADVHENELKRSQLKADDILLTITGSYGLAATVPKDLGDANINQHVVKMETDKSRIEPQYLVYFLNSSVSRSQMDRSVTGSSRLALDYKAIRSLSIACPTDIEEQKGLVGSANRFRADAQDRLNKARSLLSSEDGYLLQELGLELPSSPRVNTFKVNSDSLLGRIDAIAHDPEYGRLIDVLRAGRFKPKPLTEFATVSHGTVTPREEAPLGSFRLVELDDIDGELGVVANSTDLHGIEIKGAKTKFVAGQILVSRLRFYLRKVAICQEGGIGSTEFYTLTCKEGVDISFLKAILRHHIVVRQTDAKATGSSRPRLTRKDLETLMIPDVPSPDQKRIGKRVAGDLKEVLTLRNEALALKHKANGLVDFYLERLAA